jgi:glycosyltransferase involved in cell wall biosynthesis
VRTTLHVDLGRLWRGGQSQALLLVRGLLAEGHAAELVAVRGSPLALRAASAGVRVHTVTRHGARLHAALVLHRLTACGRFDLVHCHDAHAVTSAWLAGIARHARLVISRRVAYRLAVPAQYRAARVIAVSRFVRASVLASGLPAAQVEVVYDGVELPQLAAREAHSAPLLGCVGHLVPEKGQDALVRALPAVLAKHPGARLLLAGDGPCRGPLERLSERLGLRQAVQFAGMVEDVAAVYRSLDVFLFPSLEEPLGSSLLDAMAHGLPVVARKAGGVPEVVEDGRNGLLVPGEDFAAAVLQLLDDPALAARLGAAARQTIEERFTAQRMMEGTLAVYERPGA